MKRPRTKRRSGLGPDAERLVWLANGLAESGSRAEDRFWEVRLTEQIDQLLDEGDEDTINIALDQLYASSLTAYDELADFVESRAENAGRKRDDEDVLLIAAPMLSWSRYRIPAPALSSAVLANLRVHLQAHVLADGVRLSVANCLFSPDQLPVGYCNTARFAEDIGQAARLDQDLEIDAGSLAETTQFLSDTRYLLFAVAVARGKPMFRWQENGGDREHALTQWRNQGGACLVPLLPGCAVEVVLPDAYFAASRRADRESRAYAVRASVAFLGTALEAPASHLRAVIAPFHDTQLEEFRIGLTLKEGEQVVHGIVWPLLGAEDDGADVLAQIEATLRECGVTDIVSLDHRFPMEYCDDCGAPLYPSPDGEAVHAELPETPSDPMPRHLH
ncbi:DUF2863 family protein [Denitromonas iodatirespirans]|uniref:DUF2863 family protein n=1 Tax=Denitromonas iodatirespirans TaxID=2795389 RepID=A0A944DAX7_DENI1|nr:DUF2863 family protein [Denitromonas iodatirespirans]MBT0963405.1 DUF2863 family protein [Denitromonas iodatirespirans]